METLNLTQDQLNQLSNLLMEIPTKYGLPIYNLLKSFIDEKQTKQSEGSKETLKEAQEDIAY